jgi:N6-adenosine-specific RNA methylase IME4
MGVRLPRGKFACILADPAWTFRTYSAKGEGRSASQHYDVMSLVDIKAMPVQRAAADDCWLFLWATTPHLSQAFEVMQAWGFKYSTVGFVWVKKTKHGKLHVGMGYTTRQNAELVLIGRRGKPKRLSRSVRQIVVAKRREHSRKPDQVHARIEEFCAGPRLELFARERRKGWRAWGNETNKFEGAAHAS